jgi:hypothetical protein
MQLSALFFRHHYTGLSCINVMKKSVFLFAMSIMLLGAGCKKEYIVPNRTIFATLNPGNWIKLDGGRSYTASINMPEIDNNFNDYGEFSFIFPLIMGLMSRFLRSIMVYPTAI